MRTLNDSTSPARSFDLVTIPLFAGLDDDELDEIVRRSTPIRLPAGRTVGRENTTGFDCVLICTGSVAVSRRGEDVTELGPGSVFGEMALLGDAPHRRNASGVTTTSCDVLVFTRAELADLLRRHPVVEARIAAVMAARHPADTVAR